MKQKLIPIAIVTVVLVVAICAGLFLHRRRAAYATRTTVNNSLSNFFRGSAEGQHQIRADLQEMGAKALPAQVQALTQPGEVGMAAQLMLLNDRNAVQALPDFVRLLENSDSEARYRAAVLIMMHIRPQDMFALPALLKALGDTSVGVRERAAQAIGKLGPAAATALPALTKALDDTSMIVRVMAARSLSSIDRSRNATAISTLKGVIASGDDSARHWAAVVLYKIDPKDSKILPVFISSLTNADQGIRFSATNSLRRYGPGVGDAVLNVLKSGNPD